VAQSRHPTRPCWAFFQCAWSFHIAIGPLVYTEAGPPSRVDSLEWSSLVAIIRPFEALRLRIGQPLLESLRSQRSSNPAFLFTDSMPYSALSFALLVRW
jgi:hypothetical protein